MNFMLFENGFGVTNSNGAQGFNNGVTLEHHEDITATINGGQDRRQKRSCSAF